MKNEERDLRWPTMEHDRAQTPKFVRKWKNELWPEKTASKGTWENKNDLNIGKNKKRNGTQHSKFWKIETTKMKRLKVKDLLRLDEDDPQMKKKNLTDKKPLKEPWIEDLKKGKEIDKKKSEPPERPPPTHMNRKNNLTNQKLTTLKYWWKNPTNENKIDLHPPKTKLDPNLKKKLLNNGRWRTRI